MTYASKEGPLSSRTLVIAALLSAAGCAQQVANSGASVAVSVAPLALSGVAMACYDVSVTSGSDTVWSRGQIGVSHASGDNETLCSDQFGNHAGGDIAYVGPCDASAATNRVTLWVDGLYDANGADLGDWRDPCPAGCVLDVPCVENVDSPAVFDLTILRNAQQGFFDLAVNFDDIFCSGKIDTCDADGVPLKLLYAADGQRHGTANLALTCTAGYGAAATTHLYLDDIRVDCGAAGSWQLMPSAGPGNVLSPPLAHDSGEVWQYAVYEGAGAVDCANGMGGIARCDSPYWTIAIGTEGLPAGCRLTTRATASGAAFHPAGRTPASSVWPFIEVDALLTDDDGVVCRRDGIGEGAMAIRYTTAGHPVTFAHGLRSTAPGVVETDVVAGIPDGLLAHFAFDDDLLDSSGNAHHGGPIEDYELPTFTAGCRERAVSFDGTGQFVSVADPTYLGPGVGRPRTITAWVRASTGPGVGSVYASQYQNYNVPNSIFSIVVGGYREGDDPHVGAIADGTSSVYIDGPADGAERFHHYTTTFDTAANLTSIYIDGVWAGAGPTTFSNTSPRPLTIGGLLPREPHYFNGAIDDLMFFEGVLSSEEIRALAALGGDCL